jgi:hypothetical protein
MIITVAESDCDIVGAVVVIHSSQRRHRLRVEPPRHGADGLSRRRAVEFEVPGRSWAMQGLKEKLGFPWDRDPTDG